MADTEQAAAPPVAAAFAATAKPRFRIVPLEWPIEFGGKTYSEITIHRMSANEVREFVASSQAGGNAAAMCMFGDTPVEVIDALDPDDADTVNQAVMDFLPRSLRAAIEQALEPSNSTPPLPPVGSEANPSNGS